jgi:hypothetical protein
MKSARGQVKNGGIVFSQPLGLAEGTQVSVAIEPLPATEETVSRDRDVDFDSLPFFGIWADRDDMRDSTEWVRQERERWQQRAARPD